MSARFDRGHRFEVGDTVADSFTKKVGTVVRAGTYSGQYALVGVQFAGRQGSTACAAKNLRRVA